jgi:hypothetical protein
MFNVGRLGRLVLVAALTVPVIAQTPEPPLTDPRIPVHTLVREDLFAGFMNNDMTRFERGERNVQRLLELRPADRAPLLAWQAGAALYRAVRAYEAGQPEEFATLYRRTRELFDEAKRLNASDVGVVATTGGAFVVFSDRLPAEHRADAWAQAYDAFQFLWNLQGAAVDKLPLHIRGELLGGLTQSAQRTGRTAEAAEHLDRMLLHLKSTPYEAPAQRWKNDPDAASASKVTCMSCHEAGRLSTRLKALGQ